MHYSEFSRACPSTPLAAAISGGYNPDSVDIQELISIMPKVCALSGKKVRSGANVSHAHNVTKRKFRPNLQKKKIVINGKKKTVWVSVRALRSLTRGKTKNLNV